MEIQSHKTLEYIFRSSLFQIEKGNIAVLLSRHNNHAREIMHDFAKMLANA